MQASPESKLDFILSRLEGVKKVRAGYMARCPAHPDRNPSLAINLGEIGIVFKCWAGCEIAAIRESLGIEWEDMFYKSRRNEDDFPKRKKPQFTQEKRRAIALEAKACAARLQSDPGTLQRLRETRGWAAKALASLEVGWTGERLTLLAEDKEGNPHDILLYDPFLKGGGRKMLAGAGRSRQPWPRPEKVKENGSPVYLVEGEGTGISIATLGLPAVALPGSISKPSYNPQLPGQWRGVGWHPKWIYRFNHREYVLIPDCDEQGRMLMAAAMYDLERAGSRVTVLDLSPSNNSGFDVGDWLKPARSLEGRTEAKWWLELAAKTAREKPNRLDEVRDGMRDWFKKAREAI